MPSAQQSQRTVSARWRALRSRLSANLIWGGILVALVVLAAVFAPWIAPYSPFLQQFDQVLEAPSRTHLFGTDELGRDVFSRAAYGARVTLFVGIAATAVSLLLGVPLGLIAGYRGGVFDTVIGRIFDTLIAFPAVLLALLIVAMLGPATGTTAFVIGIVYAPTFGRLVRGNVLAIREQEFVEAARALGASDARIVTRAILPNLVFPLVIQSSLTIGYSMQVEAALSFLGLGVQPPHASWGSMLSDGRVLFSVAPWLAIWPGLCIFLAILGFNLLGDGLRDWIDPKRRRLGR